eukprot:tig00021015_g17168.t1
MPVMDGYGATRRIRHVEEGLKGVPPTPICACTALSSSKDREEMVSAGMDDLIVKPVARQVVKGILSRWGNRRNGSRRRSVGLSALRADREQRSNSVGGTGVNEPGGSLRGAEPAQ